MRYYPRIIAFFVVVCLMIIASQAAAGTICVRTTGNDSNSGLSWLNAKGTITGALQAASSGDEVWVAAGVYTERITLKNGVTLLGGFSGYETTKAQRNWKSNTTVIDGNQAGSVVVIPVGAGESTRIDGFTIMNGLEDNGGGIYCDENASPVISNNIVTGNTASDPVAYKPSGGGIYCAFQSSPTIINNIITNNTAFRGGGVFIQSHSTAVVGGNIIVGNIVANHGGGVYCDDAATPGVYNNTIVNNTALNGGGIFIDNKSLAVVINNIVAFNNSGIYREASATPTARNNCVYGNTDYNYYNLTAGAGDISADPKFVNAASGDYHLMPDSPCKDAGDVSIISGSETDIDGQARVIGISVDMGVDEWKQLVTPINVSLSPNSGTLPLMAKLSLVSTYKDDDGCQDISKCYLLLNTSFTGYGGVYLYYDSVLNRLYIRNDTNTAWIGGHRPGSSNIVENGSCKLHCRDTTVSRQGDTLVVTWNVELKSTKAGKTLGAWMVVFDMRNLQDGWEQVGSVKVEGPPSNVKLTPNSGALASASKLVFTSSYSDAEGYTDLTQCYLLINTSLTGVNAVCVRYDVNTNKLYVRNSTNSAWVGGYAPGSPNILENSVCKLYCADTTVSGAANQLTVNWCLEVKPVLNGKTCGAWLCVYDDKGLYDGWEQMGTFVIARPPQNVSLTPSSGGFTAGAKVTLTAKYADPDGYTNLSKCYLLINTIVKGANAVYLYYDADANKLYLRNDVNSAWLGGITPGTAGTIENSYCRLYCDETTVAGTGTTLSISFRLVFKNAMPKKTYPVWTCVYDDTLLNDNWEQMGQCTIQ